MKHSEAFMAAAKSLANVNIEGKEQGWKPFPLGRERERRLILAVTELANSLGASLEPIHAIDANGELTIEGKYAQQGDPKAKFGEEFSAALNQYGKPRTGELSFGYNALMEPTSTWCKINHFAAERMVLSCAGLV